MLSLHLLLSALPGKVECAFSIFSVQVIENFHQPFAAGPRRVLIKQVELGHTLAEEVAQHNASLLIAVDLLPVD